MLTPPPDLTERLRKYGQEHVLHGWNRLDVHAQAALIDQLQALDFDELQRLYAQRDQTDAVPSADRIAPLPNVLPDADDPEARAVGEQALRNGEVAALVVAGGQGSRLGFEHP